ncbi:Glycosyltransferase, GT2 family [Pseudomonas pohangensis]|uniref:Glycosyltransferase, GT2 family n=1 Tax=Pseudomonas pohangensis TaxID=364197 RepID=A0A1H2FVS5_9PSED|nr:glycosyltransferase family 2 protein [Pseudomonas pohangensis]SDU11474.1 Glycosyltransferase, GT2 family [Pseudomonas pohangensis]
MASVTVIIVNWNSGAYLRECLRSLIQQARYPDAVLIVDNASSDGSENCVSDFPDFRLICSGANLGFAAANNLALRECTTDYVALLNPDAMAEPEWLSALLHAAEARPECASFGSRQLIAEFPSMLDGVGDKYHISGVPWRERHGCEQREVDLLPREIFSPCAAAALYRRDAILAVDGFDEDYFCYIEDVDLGFRLRLLGYGSYYVPEAVVRHVGSATSGGAQSDFVLYHGHRNMVWAYIKNMPGFLFWIFLPLHILVNTMTICYFSIKGRRSVILRAKFDALKGVSRAFKKRRIVQGKRSCSLISLFNVLDKGLFRK